MKYARKTEHARKMGHARKEPGHASSDVAAVPALGEEVEAAHRHGVVVVLEEDKEPGGGGRGEDENKGPERNGHTAVSQLGMEAKHILAAHNESHMADGPGEEGDAEVQSCRAAAASAPWSVPVSGSSRPCLTRDTCP